MSDQPSDQSAHDPSERPPLHETIRAKMEAYEVDRHLEEFASTLEHAVRQGIAKVGELAHEHKGDLERLFDKAASALDSRTDGRHAETISQVRGSLERGVDKIADQRPDDAPDEPDEPSGSGVPPSNG